MSTYVQNFQESTNQYENIKDITIWRGDNFSADEIDTVRDVVVGSSEQELDDDADLIIRGLLGLPHISQRTYDSLIRSDKNSCDLGLITAVEIYNQRNSCQGWTEIQTIIDRQYDLEHFATVAISNTEKNLASIITSVAKEMKKASSDRVSIMVNSKQSPLQRPPIGVSKPSNFPSLGNNIEFFPKSNLLGNQARPMTSMSAESGSFLSESRSTPSNNFTFTATQQKQNLPPKMSESESSARMLALINLQ